LPDTVTQQDPTHEDRPSHLAERDTSVERTRCEKTRQQTIRS
jgi:hypothetical protein